MEWTNIDNVSWTCQKTPVERCKLFISFFKSSTTRLANHRHCGSLFFVTVLSVIISYSEKQQQNIYWIIHFVAPVVEKGQGVPPFLPSHTDPIEPVTIDVTEQEG